MRCRCARSDSAEARYAFKSGKGRRVKMRASYGAHVEAICDTARQAAELQYDVTMARCVHDERARRLRELRRSALTAVRDVGDVLLSAMRSRRRDALPHAPFVESFAWRAGYAPRRCSFTDAQRAM